MKIEQCPNPEVVILHVRTDMGLRQEWERGVSPEYAGEVSPLMGQFVKIPGVASVVIKGYMVRAELSPAFDREPIAAALKALGQEIESGRWEPAPEAAS